MRAHIIANGVVVNTIEVESLDVLPGLIDGSIGGIGDMYADGVFTPPAPPVVVPASVSPRQIRQALTAAGTRSAIEEAVAAGDQDLKDWWEFATAFERNHSQVIAMAATLGVTDEQLDNLFIAAGAL